MYCPEGDDLREPVLDTGFSIEVYLSGVRLAELREIDGAAVPRPYLDPCRRSGLNHLEVDAIAMGPSIARGPLVIAGPSVVVVGWLL